MTSNVAEKSYARDVSFCNFYVGGDVAWSEDAQHIYCLNNTEVTKVEVATSQVIHKFGLNVDETEKPHAEADEIDEDVIYSFALSKQNDLLLTAHRSGLLRLWSIETGKVTKLWKSQHKGPVLKVAFSKCGKFVCSSGADSSIRIWDFINSCCIAALRGYPGPALLVAFHENAEKTEIFAAGADHAVYRWNYVTKKLMQTLRGHISQVTDLSFETDNEHCVFLATTSRDKVCIFWKLENGEQHRVIPLYEELEGICYITHKKSSIAVVASANGNIKCIDSIDYKIGTLHENSDFEINQLLYNKSTNQLAVITTEQNILIYKIQKLNKLACVKQLIGFNDQIYDICYLGKDDRFLAVATNSKNIKIYDNELNMNCKIVAGHTDIVMALSSVVDSNFLLSGSKDFSICLWELDVDNFQLNCLIKSSNSHTSTIGSLSFAHNSSDHFASVCQDGSLKVWSVKKEKNNSVYTAFQVKYAAIAHEKEVNSVTFSPNNKIVATASQDKTAKLWSADAANCIGTLRGHTRGVWCVRFSPVDQVVLTSSSDCSLRLWALSNMACIKRFEQECTIIRAEFIDNGKFILAAASDGLMKLWNIKTSACIQTLDEHSERIWSLAISARSKKYFYSGGADSKLIRWQDVTQEARNVDIEKRQELLLQEQTLQSLLQEKQHLHKALMLALKLGKPKVTYNVISQYIKSRENETLKQIITQLNNDQCNTLMEHVKAWSTNSRHSKVANLILSFILSDFIAHPKDRSYNTANMVEVLTPYVQRHFKRVNELSKDLLFLDFIVKCI